MPTAEELPLQIRDLAGRQARVFSVKEAHRLTDLRELCDDLLNAGVIPEPDASVADAAQAIDGTPTLSQVAYVARAVDEAGARAAFKAWALSQSAGSGAAKVTTIELWWVPYWQATAVVSAAWLGRIGTRAQPIQPQAGQGAVEQSVNSSLGSGFLDATSMRAYMPASTALGNGMPQLLDESSEVTLIDSEEAIDTMGHELEVTVQRGTARAYAQAEFRKAALHRLCHVEGVDAEVDQLDLELDDLTAQIVWCSVWRGSFYDGQKTRSFWVPGDAGRCFVAPLDSTSDRLASQSAQVQPRAKAAKRALLPRLGVGVFVLAVTWLFFTGRSGTEVREGVAMAPSASKPTSASLDQVPTAASPPLSSSEPSAVGVGAPPAPAPKVTPRNRASDAEALNIGPAVPTQPTKRPAPDDSGQETKPSRQVLPQTASLSTDPSRASPSHGTVTAQEFQPTQAETRIPDPDPIALQPAPDQACERRFLAEYERCLRRECRTTAFHQHSACISLRQRDETQKRRETYTGG